MFRVGVQENLGGWGGEEEEEEFVQNCERARRDFQRGGTNTLSRHASLKPAGRRDQEEEEEEEEEEFIDTTEIKR